MNHWSRYLKPFLNLFLESPCPLCQRSTPQEICPTCQKQIWQCRLLHLEETWQNDPRLFTWGLYTGALRRALTMLKYDNQPQLAQPLGQWLAEAWLTVPHISKPASPLIVVPIPMHQAKQRQRGFNQAELIAASFCRITQLPLESWGLERVRATEAQFGLSALARAQNLTGAFRLGRGLKQHHTGSILLVDDIYTTGATTRSAIHTLTRHNIQVYGLIAVARTPHVQADSN
ncbi:hypothetical protein BST81_24220 [Leptolyngbya sp. 'hensonii']|uniref:ComF family protein n=1 Tax=Leptolyngbya sp. 'hensonii' TaxID=1922337 RepID=UPI00094F4ED4|nr:ComF family protein [Leptolyngbya sp. 'hensonii']OLP15855.1 hypothetical protein BST81_24220 [Leptolyngbya sp. 'hensonii']